MLGVSGEKNTWKRQWKNICHESLKEGTNSCDAEQIKKFNRV